MFFKNQDKSYDIVDLYLNHIFFGYKDSYNYYDTDVDKIFLFVKIDNDYIIRQNDVNKMKIVPLQLKIQNFQFGELHMLTNNELHMLTNNITLMPIHNDDKELSRRCRDIWNKITELVCINDIPDFVETTLDDDDEFIIVDVHKNTSSVRDKYRNSLVIVLRSAFNDYLQTSLVQYRY